MNRTTKRALKDADKRTKDRAKKRSKLARAMCTIGARSNFAQGGKPMPRRKVLQACGSDAPTLAEAQETAGAARKKSAKKASTRRSSHSVAKDKAQAKRRTAAKANRSMRKQAAKMGSKAPDVVLNAPQTRLLERIADGDPKGSMVPATGGLGRDLDSVMALRQGLVSRKRSDGGWHAKLTAKGRKVLSQNLWHKAAKKSRSPNSGFTKPQIRAAYKAAKEAEKGVPTGLGVAYMLDDTEFVDGAVPDWMDDLRDDLEMMKLKTQ